MRAAGARPRVCCVIWLIRRLSGAGAAEKSANARILKVRSRQKKKGELPWKWWGRSLHRRRTPAFRWPRWAPRCWPSRRRTGPQSCWKTQITTHNWHQISMVVLGRWWVSRVRRESTLWCNWPRPFYDRQNKRIKFHLHVAAKSLYSIILSCNKTN